MVAFNKFQPFLKACFEKKHNLAADQLVVALCNAANAPVAANGVLADLVQIAYTNLSSRNITTSSSSQSGGTYKLVLADLTLTASGAVAPFQYVVIYNDTAAADDLIGWYALPSEITMADLEELLIDLDGVNGLFTAV